SDPFLLPQMHTAVARLLEALNRRERIVLFGAYDVDGITSLALLAEVLRAYVSTPEVCLPLRMEEGYGLSPEGLERCLGQYRPQLLIAIDCGTSSATEIADLRKRDVDVIVLDHHEPKPALPDCIAIVNPKTKDSGFEYLCSVGIVFTLCPALLKPAPLPEFDLKSELDRENRERQEVEKQIFTLAIEQIEGRLDAARDAAIVVGAPGWHQGVLGIVASRIARRYHRPTIVIGFDENGIGKGSGRSIEG